MGKDVFIDDNVFVVCPFLLRFGVLYILYHTAHTALALSLAELNKPEPAQPPCAYK